MTNRVKNFASIPGPKSYPLIGTLGNYLLTKKYSFDRLHWNGKKKFEEFGPIVREEIVPGVNIVWLFDPEDIKTMFANEGACPSRRSHLALEKYRLDRPGRYNNGGLLPTNGPEWLRLRQESQKPLALQSSLAKFLPEISRACDDLIENLKDSKPEQENFLEQLKIIFMEITGIVTLGVRIGALNPDKPSLISRRLIESAFQTNANILKTDSSKLWKYLKTKEFKEICNGQAFIEETALKYINSSERGDYSLVSLLANSSKLDSKDILTVVCDMLLAGVDTSAYTSSFIIHLLATHREVQERIRTHIKEDLKLDSRSGEINQGILKKFSYGKVVLKESLRMFPVSVGVGRILPEDTTFSGYAVPKGTVVVTQNQVSCRLPQYCPNPDKFLPERWIKGRPEYQGLHPYLSLPFGFGPRMCIGRRVAEQSISILMMKLIQNFDISWAAQDHYLDSCSYLINQPDKPIHIILNKI